ncbi:MAG: hypothetical protein M3137_13795 [Actinomycetota bacterium]|nr:hypothetical protein [Actinomycetota bacterium]
MSDERGLPGVADGAQVPPGIEPISQLELPEGTLTAGNVAANAGAK